MPGNVDVHCYFNIKILIQVIPENVYENIKQKQHRKMFTIVEIL